jgi:hypothetical protein
MAYVYSHFILQNIATKGATKIGVYDGNGKKVCTIPLGRLTQPKTEKLYSFGLVSDTHLWHLTADWNPNTKFDNALTYFENQNCDLAIVCGDITEMGFFVQEIVDGKEVLLPNGYPSMLWDENQFKIYSDICKSHSISVFELCGNHENYGMQDIKDHLDKLAEYTGMGMLSYTVSSDVASERNQQVTVVGNDLFILCGQPTYNKVMSDADFAWLKTTLEANKNRRCFLFVHAYIEEDSGDPMDYRENSIFESWGASNKEAFIELIAKYPNVVLFHGHSHTIFESQELDENANYTVKNGFKSVHIPSLSKPRIINLASTPYDYSKSQGYIVDVYDDCIMLNGMDFINNKPIPIGTYKIDTTLQTVEANTFTDSTGTIQT